MRASQQIARLQAQLRERNAEVVSLKARLAANGISTFEVPEWGEGLTPGQVTLMIALLQKPNKVFSRYDLEESVIPKLDAAHDRDVKIVDVYVWRLRQKLGVDAVETVRGRGYRCGKAFADRYGAE